MYESEDKMVSHPDHYISETGMEVIDVIEAFTFDFPMCPNTKKNFQKQRVIIVRDCFPTRRLKRLASR